MKKYNASITSSLFWVQESRKTAIYIKDGLSREELCELSRKENIYMDPSDDRKRKIANTTYDRIILLPPKLIAFLSDCDLESAKIIVLLSIMLKDDLFHDFMVEVYKEKMMLGDKKIINNDVRIYIEEKRNMYEDAAKISDASVYKLGQTFIKFLIECGLVENAKTGKIKVPYIDYNLVNLLEESGYRDFISIMTGE